TSNRPAPDIVVPLSAPASAGRAAQRWWRFATQNDFHVMFSDMKCGLRREDKNEWERRVPLTPDHVRSLVQQGIQVCVQPSTIRIFKDEEYLQAGAAIKEDLSDCGVVFAVKEIPADFFRER